MPTTFQRTYVQRHNVTPAGGTLALQLSDFLFQIKQFLTGLNPVNAAGAWTVVRSSNGTVANTSDNWASAADVVQNTEGNAHSWIVLQQTTMLPGGTQYLLISANQTSGFNALITLANAAFTAGSITATPTSTSILTWINQQVLRNAFSANLRLHMLRSTVGTYWLMTGYAGSQRIPGIIANVETEQFYSSDLWPHHAFAAWSDAGIGPTGPDIVGGVGQAFDYAGAAVASVPVSFLRLAGSVNAAGAVGIAGLRNDATHLPDWALYTQIPAGASQPQLRGRWIDFREAPYGTGMLAGFVEPAGGPYVSGVMGGFWTPMNVAPQI